MFVWGSTFDIITLRRPAYVTLLILLCLYWLRDQTTYIVLQPLTYWGWNHIMMTSWKHLPRYWPFVRGIHRSPVNSPHKGQWREALMFSLICVWTNSWVNKEDAGDLRRHRAHYDVIVVMVAILQTLFSIAFYGETIVYIFVQIIYIIFPTVQLTIRQHWFS